MKAGLLVAMLPEKQARMFIVITLDAIGFEPSHLTPRGQQYKHGGALYLHFQVTASKNDIKPLGCSHLCT